MITKELRQKKHNKPIKITSVAISKVRRTRIFGFNNDENRYIQEMHKELLRISKDVNNSEEVAIAIDIVKWNHEVIIGKSNRVDMKKNPIAYNMLVTNSKNTLLIMHNHPSNSTFSGEDFKMFCDYPSIYVMTIVGNDGSVQIMEKDVDFEGQQAKIEYGKLASKYAKIGYKNNGTMAMKHIIKNPSNYKILYKHGGKKNEK